MITVFSKSVDFMPISETPSAERSMSYVRNRYVMTSARKCSKIGGCSMKHDLENINAILEYCDGIIATKQQYGDDIEDFMESLQYQWSTAFGILQIGEVVKRLSSELRRKYDDVPWSEIAASRDRAAHRYHDNDLVKQWNTIRKDIPSLMEKCLKIKQDLESEVNSEN